MPERFQQEVLDHITGVGGTGPVRVYIYKVYLTLERERLYLIVSRFILGPKYKLLTELWKAMLTGQLVFFLVFSHWLNFHIVGK